MFQPTTWLLRRPILQVTGMDTKSLSPPTKGGRALDAIDVQGPPIVGGGDSGRMPLVYDGSRGGGQQQPRNRLRELVLLKQKFSRHVRLFLLWGTEAVS